MADPTATLGSAAAPTDGTTPLDFPGSDVYVGAEAAANTAYSNALARLNQQRGQTLNQFGYLGNVDPGTGALSGIRVDPNNPYGQYQQLLRNSALESESAHNNAASRGLQGGLANQGETQSKYDYGQGANTLGTNLQNTLGGFDTSQVDSENQRDQSVLSSRQQAAAAALGYQQSQAQISAMSKLQAQIAAEPVPEPGQAPVYNIYTGPGSVGSDGSDTGGTGPTNPDGSTPSSPGGADSGNPGSGDVDPKALAAYLKTPVGKAMAKASATTASGAAGVLTKQTKKNYQAARNAI